MGNFYSHATFVILLMLGGARLVVYWVGKLKEKESTDFGTVFQGIMSEHMKRFSKVLEERDNRMAAALEERDRKYLVLYEEFQRRLQGLSEEVRKKMLN